MAGIGKPCTYPCVPGHELAGVCTAVGAKVTKVKVGDHVGVGCRVGACLECKMCKAGEEQKCSKGAGTYDTDDKSGIAATFPSGGKTIGGYTSKMVVHEHFAIIIPKSMPLEVRVLDSSRRFRPEQDARAGSHRLISAHAHLCRRMVPPAHAPPRPTPLHFTTCPALAGTFRGSSTASRGARCVAAASRRLRRLRALSCARG